MGEAKRLFFGLELPDSCKQSIIQWRAQTFPAEAGRPVAADALHLTLDDAGHWPHSGVVWLGQFTGGRTRYKEIAAWPLL